MIILFALLIILLFVIVIIDVILYDYDVSYHTHKVLRYTSYFIMLVILIMALIACVTTSNSSYKSTSTIPIVTPILLPVH